MRNAQFWLECAAEVGIDFETSEDAVKFLTSVCELEAVEEAMNFFGEIFVTALYREIGTNRIDPVFEYFTECEPANGIFRLFIVGADRHSGICLTLIPKERRAAICISVDHIRSLNDLNEVFESVLEHVRSVYCAFRRKQNSGEREVLGHGRNL